VHSIPANNSFFFAIFSKLNLEMNTLEDAFINIGMDEEKYLNPGENIVTKIILIFLKDS